MSPISLDALNRPIPQLVVQPATTSLHVWMEEPERRPDPTLLTINEVAAALRVSEKTVQRRIKDGTIRPVQMGGRLVRISSDELARLIAGDPPKAPWNNVDIPE
jgi:excisionase family DNA binding protein